jgi:23S rRNA (pseudouridine1915-N3)-methyltransferase
LKIYLYFIGKPRDAALNAAAGEYVRRCSNYARCDMREIRPDRFDIWARHPSAMKVLLDPGGRTMDSAAFASLLGKAEQDGREIAFLVGGHNGLPAQWRPKADLLLSLSAMTWPHELARVLLAEQIYRAFTILRGHPYPR